MQATLSPVDAKVKLDDSDILKAGSDASNAQFSVLGLVGGIVGLPAVSAAAALGTTASLAAIPLAFDAMAAKALASNSQVRASVISLRDEVESSVAAMAQPLAGEFVGAIDTAKQAFVRLEPQINAAMVGSAKDVGILTDGVVGFASNAMPGFVTAVGASQAPMRGFSSLLTSTGAGLTDFFRNLSTGSQASERDMQVLGHTVQGLEGFLGSFLANLTNGASGPLTQFDGALNAAEHTLLNLTQAGGPAMSFLGGFTGATSGALSVLEAASNVLGLLPPELGQFAGAATASGLLLSKFGVDVKGSFDGIKPAVDGAEGALGKLKAGASSLASAALSPAVVATAGLSAGLMILGEEQQQSAQSAAVAARSQQDFTSALRESKGALDANVRSQVAQDLAQKSTAGSGKSILDFAQQYGVQLPLVTDAVMGNSDAMTQLTGELDAYAKANPGAAENVNLLKVAIQGKTGAFKDSQQALIAEASATTATHTPLTVLQQDVQKAGDTSQQTTTRVSAFNDALKLMSGDALSAAQAADNFTKAEQGLSAQLDHGHAVLTGNSAAALANRDSVFQAVQAAQQHAQAVFQQTGNLDLARQALANDEGALESNMYKTYGNRDSVDALLRSVGALPSQTNTALGGFQDFAKGTNTALGGIQDRHITVTASGQWLDSYIGGVVGGGGNSSLPPGGLLPLGRNAEGGAIRGPGTETSDSIPSLLSNNEYVVKASAHRKYGTHFMDALNEGRLKAFAAGGAVLDASESVGRIGPDGVSWVNSEISVFASAIGRQMRRAMAAGGGAAQAIAASMLGRYGWGQDQMASLIPLWTRESNWNPNIVNQSSGAYGIPQALPAVWGHPYALGDAPAQIRWGLDYIAGRYGSPAAAEAHETAFGWYDNGGYMLNLPGVNTTGRPEMVLPPDLTEGLRAMIEQFNAASRSGSGSGGGVSVVNNVYAQSDPHEIAHKVSSELAWALRH